jgi:hypothetical protein
MFQSNITSSVPDPWHFGIDPDPWIRTSDKRIRIWFWILPSRQQQIFFFCSFFAYYVLRLHLHDCSKIKVAKKSYLESRFSYYFCLMIEGSGSRTKCGAVCEAVSLSIVSGSGVGRPKNLRIRIRNTEEQPVKIAENHQRTDRKKQCCGSMTFWCGSGSGSADPCRWLMDPDPNADPDPSIFIIDLQNANKKLI